MNPGKAQIQSQSRIATTQEEPEEEILRLSEVAFAWRGPSAFALAVDRFSVPCGQKLLLMGPSGSGKSTLLALVCGVLRADRGSIEVAGTEITALGGAACDRFRAEHFGIIFQMFNLLPYGSVLDNVLLPLSFAPTRRSRVLAAITPQRPRALQRHSD